jgi:beta-1,4-N-acetylglucosaminyltransferase
MGKTAFVTVGTTLFESLIETVNHPFCLEQLVEHGYTKLVIQYGKGKRPPSSSSSLLQIECYDFKPSLLPDLRAADLILSHAGAGTLMEATSLLDDDGGTTTRPKVIIVAVINTILMDNHQTELAYALRDTGCLCVVETARDLLNVDSWRTISSFRPTPFPRGDDDDVPRILNHFFGFLNDDRHDDDKDD